MSRTSPLGLSIEPVKPPSLPVAPAGEVTAKDLLRATLRYLTITTWLKGDYRDESGNRSLPGALKDAKCRFLLMTHDPAHDSVWDAWFVACQSIRQALNGKYGAIQDWNDLPETQWDDVVDVVERAIIISETFPPMDARK